MRMYTPTTRLLVQQFGSDLPAYGKSGLVTWLYDVAYISEEQGEVKTPLSCVTSGFVSQLIVADRTLHYGSMRSFVPFLFFFLTESSLSCVVWILQY